MGPFSKSFWFLATGLWVTDDDDDDDSNDNRHNKLNNLADYFHFQNQIVAFPRRESSRANLSLRNLPFSMFSLFILSANV